MTFLQNILNLFTWSPEKDYQFSLPETPIIDNNISESSKLDIDNKEIYPSIDVNLEFVKTAYNTMINSDIVVREFSIIARNRYYKAFLLFIDGMVNSTMINDFVLRPLMLKNQANSFDGEQNKVISEAVTNNITVRKIKKFDITSYISNCLIPQNSFKKVKTFSEVFNGVNSGNCALFIDTLNVVFDIEVKGFMQRSISSPQNETVIKGPHEAFVENIRTNTSMIRKILNNENLIMESASVGKVTKTKCAICYMKNITNDDLIAEVQYRISNLQIDSLLSVRSIRATYC